MNHLISYILIICLNFCFLAKAMGQQCDIEIFMHYIQDVGNAWHFPANTNNKLSSFSSKQIWRSGQKQLISEKKVVYDKYGRIIHLAVTNHRLAYTFNAEYYPNNQFQWHQPPDTSCSIPFYYNGHPLVFTSRFTSKRIKQNNLVTDIMQWDPAEDDMHALQIRIKNQDTTYLKRKPIKYSDELQSTLFLFKLTSLPAEYFVCEINASNKHENDSLSTKHFTLDQLSDTTLTYIMQMGWPWRHIQYDVTFTPPYYTITETLISRNRIRKKPGNPTHVALIHYNGRPAQLTWHNKKTGEKIGTKTYTYDQYGNFQLIEVQRPGTKLIRQFNNVYFDAEQKQIEELSE